MFKRIWLIIVGILALFAVFVAGVTSFLSPYYELRYPFMVLGGIGGFQLIGMGIIIDHIKGGDKK